MGYRCTRLVLQDRVEFGWVDAEWQALADLSNSRFSGYDSSLSHNNRRSNLFGSVSVWKYLSYPFFVSILSSKTRCLQHGWHSRSSTAIPSRNSRVQAWPVNGWLK